MRRLALILCAVLMVSVGCDGDNGDEATPDTTAATTTTTAPEPEPEPGAPIDSGVEGVPIPENAAQDPDRDNLWYVPVSDDSQLLDWYEEHLPLFTDHNGWEWCRLFEPIDGYPATTWAYVGDEYEDEFGPVYDYLEVTVFGEDEDRPGEGAIIIGTPSGSAARPRPWPNPGPNQC